MPKYLITASYSAEGLQGLREDSGSGRRDAARQAIESLGGRLEAYYFAFGADDVISIADLPNNIAAGALSLAVSATEGARIRVTPLLTPEEVDQAVGMSVHYRATGR